MQVIENQCFDEERALYESRGVEVRNCRFDGPADGESEYFMMRSADLTFDRVKLKGKYSFQYISDSVFTNCEFDTKDASGKIVAEGGKHKNATYEMCGPQALTGKEVEDIFNRVAGTNVTTDYFTEQDMDNLFSHAKFDSYTKEALYALQRTYVTWGFSGNGNVLEWLLGHPGTTFEEYVRKELTRLGKPVVG